MQASWFEEFDELAQDVAESENSSFAHNLQRWFDFLDSNPSFSRHFRDWEFSAELKDWLLAMEKDASPVVGSNVLRWPQHKLERLALQLVLFRAFAAGELVVPAFALRFFTVDVTKRHYSEVISQKLFVPFSRELRRELQGLSLSEEGTVSQNGVPASDRDVPLDHNSADYRELVDALKRIERAIVELNDFPRPERKNRIVKEIQAGQILVEPEEARPPAVWGVLGTPLKWLMKIFAEKEIGHLADLIWKLLVSLLGGP